MMNLTVVNGNSWLLIYGLVNNIKIHFILVSIFRLQKQKGQCTFWKFLSPIGCSSDTEQGQ